jgi:hypothetical protein
LTALLLSLPAALFPALGLDLDREATEALKLWLLLGAALLVALGRALPRRWGTGLLCALALLATLNYARWGPKVPLQRVDTYDLMHYYLNARYFDELGYYDLYPAVIFADHEQGGPHFDEGNKYLAQNNAGHGVMPISHALERGAEVKASRFSPARWAAFSADMRTLQRELPGLSDSLWREMIQDHGFNGTPVWTWLARPLAQAVPLRFIKWLCAIDLVLLVAAVGAVGRAYGLRVGLWAWTVLMLSYSARWPTITWAFLRYDYVAGLLFAMAAIKRGHHLLAGALVGWAGALRLFPLLWMTGPLLLGLDGLWRGVVRQRLLVLAAGCLLGLGALELGATAGLGADTVRVHFENMLDHNKAEKLSSRRIGLALALPFRGETLPKYIEPARKALIEEQKPLRFGLSALALLGLGLGLRHKRDDEALGLGFIPFFLLTTASYYYYITRLTLVVVHSSRLDAPRHRVALLLLLAVELFANGAEVLLPGHRVFHIGGQAWLLSAYVLWVVGSGLWPRARGWLQGR